MLIFDTFQLFYSESSLRIIWLQNLFSNIVFEFFWTVLIKTVLIKEERKLYKVFSCILTEYNDLQANFRKFIEKQP